jgi:hypothetical protein
MTAHYHIQLTYQGKQVKEGNLDRAICTPDTNIFTVIMDSCKDIFGLDITEYFFDRITIPDDRISIEITDEHMAEITAETRDKRMSELGI